MSVIRWGLLGAGTMAELFVEAVLSLAGAKVQAVAARTQESANKFAAHYRIPLALPEYDRLLAEPSVDVIYISTPNEYHREHCLKAIGAGKAVLCEKPFALNAAEAREVIESARARGVFCMEAMWMRFAPAVREAMTLAKQGKLGTLQLFSGQLGFPYVVDENNRLFRQPGGGALLDLGVYPLSLAQALLGSPVKVASSAQLTAGGVDEQFAAILDYKEGTQAFIAASLKAKLSNAAAIHGQNAVLQLDQPLYFPERYQLLPTAPHSTGQKQGYRKASKLRYNPAVRALADLRSQRKVHRVSKRVPHSGYAFEAAEVQRCLQAGLHESPEMTWNDTLAVLESMDAIRAGWEKK
jgi:predicted dehydrogenase